jgi:hypothetical protein
MILEEVVEGIYFGSEGGGLRKKEEEVSKNSMRLRWPSPSPRRHGKEKTEIMSPEAIFAEWRLWTRDARLLVCW